MQPVTKQTPTSDDEDDLESLRLAALQSLKRAPVATNNGSVPVPIAPKLCNATGFTSKNVNKRGRGFHGGGRTARNGAFNNRIRNSNLISVQTIEPEKPQDLSADVSHKNIFSDKSTPKLILPQDRYCNTKPSTDSKVCEASSKFDRYNDSDNSESDSESEDETTSDTESSKKLERASSLEALMQELENEIQGDIKTSVEIASKHKSKVKKSRKSKEITDSEISLLESSDELCPSETEAKINSAIEKDELNCDVAEVDVSQNRLEDKEVVHEDLPAKVYVPELPVRRKSKSPVKPSALPSSRRPPIDNCVPQNPVVNQPISNLPYMNPNVPVSTSLLPFQAMPYTNFNLPLGHAVQYDHPPLHYNFPNVSQLGCPNDLNSPPQQMFSPNRYERPISPLTIKTDILNTISAPLSPRSAAFVLQNREIIERRKKSPRRSYSRSPSPEFRRSISPRYRRSNSRPSRSPSPVRQRLSPNRRISPVRRASPSNRRLSPNIRRPSPSSQPSSRRSSPNTNRYRTSPPSGRNSPKRPRRSPPRSNIRNRLGTQPVSQSRAVTDNETERKIRKRSRSISLSLSPSPDRSNDANCLDLDDIEHDQNSQSVNPVLEARRRKFEASGSVPTEGIIRLKPKINDEEDALLANDNDEDEKVESQTNTNQAEELNEDELLGGDDTYLDFNLKVDDLFSDEESDDNENEGRFKSGRQQTPRGIALVPFTQLMNGSSNNVKSEAPLIEKRLYDRERDRRDRNRFERGDRGRSDRDRNSGGIGKNLSERNRYKEDRDRESTRNRLNDRQRSRSPIRAQTRDTAVNSIAENKHKSDDVDKNIPNLGHIKNNTESVKKMPGTLEKRPLKSLMSLKLDIKPERKKPPIVSPIENKKIEIKIRNPAKYEVENRSFDNPSKMEDATKDKKSNSRKVEVASDLVVNETEEGEFEEPDPEVIVDNEEDEDDDVINKNEGDLRAQLSRKRAERQNKLPKMEGVPSRLLQNALQGAVFKKTKKSKSKKKEKETAPLDGVEASVYAAIRRTTAKTGYGVAEINCYTTSKERKVRILHCDAEALPITSGTWSTNNSYGKLPIHLRLGIPGSMDIFTESKSHKKTSRKRSKNRGNFDQV